MPETVKALSIRGNIVDIEKDKFIIRVAGYCLIVHKNKILLVHTKSTGKYFFPGGEVEAGEKLETCMKREVLEEAGIIIEIEKFITFREIFFYYDPKNEALQKYAIFYKCKALTLESTDKYNLSDDESEKPTWVEIDSLKEKDFQPGVYEIFQLL